MEKVDVIVRFYQKWKHWPHVARGLNTNAEAINKVIVVNDELWGDKGSQIDTQLRIPHVLLDHEHRGFGAHRSFNQGARAVETEYFLIIDGDMVLAPQAIQENLAWREPGVLVGGLIHDTVYDPDDFDYAKPQLLRADWRLGNPDPRLWPMMRFGHMLIHTETNKLLGGTDEGYNGYGLIDYDYGTRWVIEKGPESFILGTGATYHIGGIDKPEDKTWKQVSDESRQRFEQTVKRLEAKYEQYPNLY